MIDNVVEHSPADGIVGALSGKFIPAAKVEGPRPQLSPSGVILNGKPVDGFALDPATHYRDNLSPRRKFGLLLPATNTTMEHELWSLLVGNAATPGLDGIGLHTTVVSTPKPRFGTPEELQEYRRLFLQGLQLAVPQALLAAPDYLILGMSLEHILAGLDDVKETSLAVEAYSGLGLATWHEASAAALDKLGARRIGLLTPFEATGNRNAECMFTDLGYDVVSTVGFSCAQAAHIAHLPDWAKEKAILELFSTAAAKPDAIVQCGTNMSLARIVARLEPVIGIPIVAINTALLWYSLRETGILSPMTGAGRLLREF